MKELDELRVSAFSIRLLRVLELTETLGKVSSALSVVPTDTVAVQRHEELKQRMEFICLELALMSRGWDHLGVRPLVGEFNGGVEITIGTDMS